MPKGRKCGSTTEASYSIKTRIHALRTEGYSYGSIVDHLAHEGISISKSYVQKVLREPITPIDPHEIMEHMIMLKEENISRGYDWIFAQLARTYPETMIPSRFKAGQVFKERGLTNQPIYTARDRRPYWMIERPSQPGQLVQIDTLQTVDAHGKRLYLITVIDVVSKIAWAEFTRGTSGNYLIWTLKRAFAAMGSIPTIVQSDNGFGMICPSYRKTSAIIEWCFSEGVQTYRFIPPGDAKRNGGIERWHKELRKAWEQIGRYSNETKEAWLNTWLYEYNTILHHRDLSGHKRTEQRSPADCAPYQHQPVEKQVPVYPKPKPATQGTLSYSRHVDRKGIARIDTSGMMLIISEGLAGNYVQIDFDLASGTGHVIARAVLEEGTWAAPEIIGTFTHSMGQEWDDGGIIQVEITNPGHYKPLPYDDYQFERWTQRTFKRGKPEKVAKGYELREEENGYWEIVHTKTGEAVITRDTGAKIEHEEQMYDGETEEEYQEAA